MGKPKAPKPADPRATAGAQTASGIATAIAQQRMAQTDRKTPYGSLTYQQTGTTDYTDPLTGKHYSLPHYTQTTALSPEQQAIYDKTTAARSSLATTARDRAAKLGRELDQPLDAGPITRSYGTDYAQDRKRVEDALMARMTPSLEADRKRLESRLASQGIRMGSEAYQSAMDDYSRHANDARLDAILKGGQEQSRLAGLAERRARFEDEAQAQAFQQKSAQRSQFLNEIMAMLGGSQVKSPSFASTPSAQIPGTDYAGLQSQYDAQQQQRYRQRMASWQDTMGGLFGLGAAAIPSDRRVKTAIKRVGKTKDGQPIYRFRYKAGGPIQMGLMAQDVEKTKPQAVKTVGGVKMVDYGKALS